MSNFPCPTALVCPCEVTPWRNISSEAPDPADFFAMAFFAGSPPLNAPAGFWTISGSALGTCESIVSPQDAQDCATRGAESTVWDTWVDGSPPVPVRQFGNVEQVCVIPCATGETPFTYTLVAGTVIATSQAEADEFAASICLYRARLAKVCVPVPPVIEPTMVVVPDLVLLTSLANGSSYLAGQSSGGAAAFFDGATTIYPSGVFGVANAVNDLGNVAGNFFTGNQDGFWYDGVDRDLGSGTAGTVDMLGMSSDGFSIYKDQGGLVTTSKLYNPGVFPIPPSFTNLGFLPGGTLTIPGAFGLGGASNLGPIITIPRRVINAVQQMTTTVHQMAISADDGTNFWACRYTGGVLVPISPLFADLPPFGNNGNGSVAIDQTGAVLGIWQQGAPTAVRAFINLSGGRANSVDLGGVGTNDVKPVALSDQNQIACGICDDGGGFGNDGAWRWNIVEGFKLIPRLTIGVSMITGDCNSFGDVVGYDNNSVGWLCRNGIVYKIIDILDAWGTDPHWTAITTAELINDQRQIAGFGIRAGVSTCYLLTLPDGAELGP